MKKEIISITLLLLTALLWGSGFPIRKMTLEYLTPMYLNFLRFAIGAVLVFIFYLIVNKGRVNPNYFIDDVGENSHIRFPVKKQIFGGTVMGIMLALGSAFQQMALLTTSSGKTAFLTTLYTIMVPILSALVLRHKVGIKTWISALVAVIGIYLIGGGFEFKIEIGDVFAILCAFTFAIQVMVIDHFSPRSNGIFLSLVQMSVAALGNLLLSLIFENANTLADISDAIWLLLYAAVMALAIPYTLQILGQKHTRSSISAIVLSMESVFGALFGVIILKEVMTAVQLTGCALILAAIIATQVGPKSQKV